MAPILHLQNLTLTIQSCLQQQPTMKKLKLKNLIQINSIFCILILQGCNTKIRTENYFLPKDFEGNVAVIYTNVIKENKDIYNFEIPEDGILRTPYSFHEGNYRINYYQKNEFNGFDTLYEELPSKKIDTTKNRIYFNRVLSFEKYTDKERYTVSTFYVGKKKASELIKDRFFFERRLEETLLGKKK